MKKISILLVEDAEMVIKTVQDILFNYTPTKKELPNVTFDLTVAFSFESALKVREKKFDLVLLDNDLPQKDSNPKDKYGIYLPEYRSECGYELIGPFKKNGSYVVGTSSGNKKANYDRHWNKSGLESWDELVAILVYVSQKK